MQALFKFVWYIDFPEAPHEWPIPRVICTLPSFTTFFHKFHLIRLKTQQKKGFIPEFPAPDTETRTTTLFHHQSSQLVLPPGIKLRNSESCLPESATELIHFNQLRSTSLSNSQQVGQYCEHSTNQPTGLKVGASAHRCSSTLSIRHFLSSAWPLRSRYTLFLWLKHGRLHRLTSTHIW